MTSFIEDAMNRVLKVKDADFGLFILAMHSLIEHELKEKYKTDSESFGILINRYTDDYRDENTINSYLPKDKRDTYRILRQIYTNHYITNRVRHQFEKATKEETQASIVCFLAFAKAEGWTTLQTVQKLKTELDNWENHSSEQSEELRNAIETIKKLKNENENLTQKANELLNLQKQLEILNSKETLLENELSETKTRLSKKDEKLDTIRQENNKQKQQFSKEKKEILDKIKDYEDTKKYVSILERISFCTKTRHDFEQSIISLSAEQKEVLSQIKLNMDYLIKGAAGTGKSLVLIKTLEKAMNDLETSLDFDKATPFRLLTYTKSLVKYNQYVTKLLKTQIPENAITTADSFLFTMLKNFFPGKTIKYNATEFSDTLFESNTFSKAEIWTEANEFVWANCITKEQYIDEVCNREGMKFSLKKNERIEMWNAIEKFEAKLEESNIWPRNFAAKKIAEMLAQKTSNVNVEYSFVDEAQDLPPVILAVIKNSTNKAVFLAGDSDQSIYRKGFNWNRSGINIRGRTKILKTNFRNTIQIHEYAENYRKKITTMDTESTPVAFRPGPPVEHYYGKKIDDLITQMLEQVKLLLTFLNYEEENICIIANTSKKLEKIKTKLDEKLGVDSQMIADNNFNFTDTKGIRLCTMQNCKGLDFPVVLLLADHRVYANEDNCIFDENTYYTQQYNLVYVSLTRAMEMLYVYTIPDSEFEPFKRLE